MDLIEVSHLIRAKISESELTRRELPALAKKKAEAERAYRVALAKKMFELKSDTEKKLAANMITDIAKGDVEVSQCLFERDLSEDIHSAKASSLKAIATEISALQSIMRVQEEV